MAVKKHQGFNINEFQHIKVAGIIQGNKQAVIQMKKKKQQHLLQFYSAETL